jgi:hypothetical protein
MIKVNKKINLAQLDKELNGRGLVCSYDDDGQITAVGLASDNDAIEEDLKSAINKHIALPTPEPTIEDKLASVGLSLPDLKAALGL